MKNPFSDPKRVADYEGWYYTAGKRAAHQEKQLLKSLVGRYREAKTLLDVGCGTGYFTSWFRTLGLEALGIDLSRHMIHAAHQQHGLDCIQGDLQRLPFPDKAFDLLSYITTLEFVSNPDHALSEGIRVARQGLILGVINRHSLLGQRHKKEGGPVWGIAKFYTPGELSRMVSEFLHQDDEIIFRTTLFPLVRGSTRLPWGGFIGMAVSLAY